MKLPIRLLCIITSFLSFLPGISQSLTYSNLESSFPDFKTELKRSGRFFTNYPDHDQPYFQDKTGNVYIKIWTQNTPLAVIDFKSRAEFLKIYKEIRTKARFLYDACFDYRDPVVSSFESSLGNIIRVKYDKQEIIIDFPSQINDLLLANFDQKTVFVCVSADAYAYHTNIRCEGLGNCEAKIAKTTIREAQKYDYQYCKICMSGYKPRGTAAIKTRQPSKSSNNTPVERSSSNNSESATTQFERNNEYKKRKNAVYVKEAERMFDAYLPKILQSKGPYTVLDNRRIFIGDFNNDGEDDIIIYFVYSTGGTSIDGVEMAFYEVKNGRVKVVAGYESRGRFSVENIYNGIVYINEFFYAEDDAHCCPSIVSPAKLAYSNGKIITIE